MKQSYLDAFENLLTNPPMLIVRELLGDLSDKEIAAIRQCVVEYDKLQIGEIIYAAFERWAAAEASYAGEPDGDYYEERKIEEEENRYIDRMNAKDINRG